MRVLVAGSGAVGISTAYQLSAKRHMVALLSSAELGSPYPSEDIPTFVKGVVAEIPVLSVDENLALADAIFCSGSISMLWRFIKCFQAPLTKPIFFLTSWSDSLDNLKNELKSASAYIIPCYPAFACELVEGDLVQVGHYQLEVANDWLESDKIAEIRGVLSSLSIRYQLLEMKTRFMAHFGLTQFAYWFLRNSKLHGDNSEATKQLLESKWQLLVARCSEHPDLCMSWQFLTSSILMILNHKTQDPSMSKIVSALLGSKAYKMDYFLDR